MGLSGSPFRLLGEDELALALAAVGDDRAWLLACVCRSFATIVRGSALPQKLGRLRTIRFFTPISAVTESIALLDWARAQDCALRMRDSVACAIAAGQGRLDVLRWALLVSQRKGWSEWIAPSAAMGGHLHVLAWLRTDSRCAWRQLVCEAAAGGGCLRTLQFVRDEAGCAWNAHASTAAAREGHLAVLQWALAEGCPLGKDARMAAAFGGHLHVLRSLEGLRPASRWDRRIGTAAAAGGHLDVLAWAAAQRGCKFSPSACAAAARRGDVRCLRWLRAHGAPCHLDASLAAAAFGHLALLRALHEGAEQPAPPRHTQAEWSDVRHLAAERGHAQVAEWAAARLLRRAEPGVPSRGHMAVLLQLSGCAAPCDVERERGGDDGADSLGLWARPYVQAFARRRAREIGDACE